jgi:error-prone DNA polymerase
MKAALPVQARAWEIPRAKPGLGPKQVPFLAAFHSCYDFGHSLLTPQGIVEAAVAHGLKTVGLCDPNLHAAREFFAVARSAGLRPVLGADLWIEGAARRVWVATTRGYENLCRLLSQPAITELSWCEHRAGLWLSPHRPPPIRLADPADRPLLRLLESIHTCSLFSRSHPEKTRGEASIEAFGHWHRSHPEAAALEARFLENCTFTFTTGELYFPHFSPPDGSTPAAFLRRLARTGLRGCYGPAWKKHRKQLETELSMIHQVGYEEYFLTVWDLLQECREAGIDWITRGSAADSLVCHTLGISHVCPVRFELYFQRFLNPERMALKKLPDIDVDFPHDRRDEVVERLFRRHPVGHVAAVGGFNTYQGRAAVAEIAKALGMPDHEAHRLTEHFPHYTRASQAAVAAGQTPAAVDGWFATEPARLALTLAERLDGLPRHRKIHPCGLVLSRRPILDFTPVFLAEKGWPATHFEMDAVEEAGLVKLDLLAQGGLAVLRDTARLVRDCPLADPAAPRRPPRRSWEDPAVWEMIAMGEARGVHHIESPAMTSLEKMCGCRDIDTLIAIVSVIRPGAANTLRKATFARRCLGLEEASYPHPSLEPILRRTHGVIAYEEHILQICESFAGLPPGRADRLRRALVKMRAEEIERLRGDFFVAATEAGHTSSEIEAVWALVSGFRGYAFCRAHSTAYALEAYEAAWFKKYFPAEFLAAVLTHEKGFYSPLFYSLEARRLGIEFLLPDVQTSRMEYFPVYGGMKPDGSREVAIRVPLWKIKGLPAWLPERILSERKKAPFQSVQDLSCRTTAPPAALQLLLRAGALDGLSEGSASRVAMQWELQHLAQLPRREPSGQFSLFEEADAWPEIRQALPEGLIELSREERLAEECELLGYPVSGHPLDLHPEVPWETYCPIARLPGLVGQRVTVAGVVVAERSHAQRDGRPMKFLTLADRTGFIEAELFARAAARWGHVALRHPILALTGRVMPFAGGGGFTLQVERAAPCRGNSSTAKPRD